MVENRASTMWTLAGRDVPFGSVVTFFKCSVLRRGTGSNVVNASVLPSNLNLIVLLATFCTIDTGPRRGEKWGFCVMDSASITKDRNILTLPINRAPK